MRIKSQGESGRCSSSGRIKGWDKRGKVEESQEPSQEPSVKIQEQKVKENTDEIGKLPKRDRIRFAGRYPLSGTIKKAVRVEEL